MDQHLIDLSWLWQIKILYNLTDKQLGKPPKHPSFQTKSLEDGKLHLNTRYLHPNLKTIHCRSTIWTCGSEARGSPWWHHLQSPHEWLGNLVLCLTKGHQEISSGSRWAVGQTALPWRWRHHACTWYCFQTHGRLRCVFRLHVCFFFSGKILDFYLLLNSMSNSLIETSAIETFPKFSSWKLSLGNSGTSSSFPFP